MKREIIEELKSGELTEGMDFGSKEYEDFKLLIRSKVSETSKKERIEIGLLSLKYHMEDYILSKSGKVAAGKFVKKFIEVIEISQKDFANYLGMKPSNLSKIISGERRINVEMSLILEKLSKIEAELWLGIQNHNEIRRVQKSNIRQMNKYNLKELLR